MGRFGKKIEDCKSFSYKAKMKFLVLLMVLISRGDGLMFNLEANSRKCLKEEIHKGVLVTDDYDVYEICFLSRVPGGMKAMRHEVFLQTKHGVEAKSYEGLADANKLKPLEIELKRLEDLSESIVQDFAHMRQREEEMRDTNESTNSRVLYFSIFSMCCLLGLATWQVLYLRKYFKSKKLIE